LDKAEKEHGYLAIASMMVKKAGYHEAIDTYIEERTPYLKTEAGKPELFLNGTPLHKTVNSDCHLLLKKLEIQNIYTFNYDNALEYFLGEEARQEAENDIIRQEGELETIRARISQQGQLISKLKEQLESIVQQELEGNGESPVANDTNATLNKEDIQKEIEEVEKERIHNLKKEEELKENIEKLKFNRTSYYHVVKDSYDISLSAKRKSIYKIHGSLREPNATDYGFDGDKHTQYIITQEDYDTYNEKHGAFVSMMRIDLLRNRFCIMGVSGGDANFLAWINWVKDVLDKTKALSKNDKEDKHQSYFVYSSSYDMPADMILMLRNHFIEPVILKDFFPASKTDEERIKLFLEYVQPLRSYDVSSFADLWSAIEVPRLPDKTMKKVDGLTAKSLFSLADLYKYTRPKSVVHYVANDVQFASNKIRGRFFDPF
jgi:hypothetical protein